MCLAVPGEVLERTDGPGGLAFGRVRFGSVEKSVCLACVPDVGVGDWVIVHVGFAIQRLDREAAERTLALLREATGGGDA